MEENRSTVARGHHADRHGNVTADFNLTITAELIKGDRSDDQQASFNTCFDALLYQDGCPKPLTCSTLQCLEASKAILCEADTLFLEGIRRYHQGDDSPFKYFSQAEEKGCKHPALYYYLGECYGVSTRGVTSNHAASLEYYDKAIAGMYSSACSLFSPDPKVVPTH